MAAVLDRAAQRLDEEFTGSQATRGALLHALGETYTGLGLTDKAVRLLERAYAVRKDGLGAEHPDTLHSRRSTSHRPTTRPMRGRVRPRRYRADSEATLKIRVEYEAGRFPTTPEHARKKLANTPLANTRYLNAPARTQHDSSIHMLHECSTLKARYMEAQSGSPRNHPDTLQSRNNLAETYRGAGRIAEAIRSNEQTLKLREPKMSTC